MKLPIKDVEEKKLVRFEFATEIEAGLTMTDVVITAEVLSGSDPNPAALLDGVPVLDQTNLYALQRVTGGVADVQYLLRALATDSSGLKHLVPAVLPVSRQTA